MKLYSKMIIILIIGMIGTAGLCADHYAVTFEVTDSGQLLDATQFMLHEGAGFSHTISRVRVKNGVPFRILLPSGHNAYRYSIDNAVLDGDTLIVSHAGTLCFCFTYGATEYFVRAHVNYYGALQYAGVDSVIDTIRVTDATQWDSIGVPDHVASPAPHGKFGIFWQSSLLNENNFVPLQDYTSSNIYTMKLVDLIVRIKEATGDSTASEWKILVSFYDRTSNALPDGTAGGDFEQMFILIDSRVKIYTISAESEDTVRGTVSGGGEYEEGSSVTLRATPSIGYRFVSWKEADTVVSTSDTYTFEAQSNRTFVAYFALSSYEILATSDPAEGGTITGDGTYTHGAEVTLVATPSIGYRFLSWKEADTLVSSSANYSFTATANRTFVAYFALSSYEISATSDPVEGGTITGDGTYTHGAEVTLVATPSIGYRFVSWKEADTVVSTSDTYTFQAQSNRTFVAYFALSSYEISATSDPVEGGTITGDGTYTHGAEVTLVATPSIGYRFVSWKEADTVVSTSDTYTFQAQSNRTFVAYFALSSYEILATSDPVEGGTITGDGTYTHGAEVTLVATPSIGYRFVSWKEADTVVSTSDTYTFQAQSNRTFVAHFVEESTDIELIEYDNDILIVSEPAIVSIYTLSGERLFSQKVSSRIELYSLPRNSVYIIHVETPTRSRYMKIIKK